MATGPRPAPSAAGLKVVAAAKKFLGGKYVWGGENPKVGFDCSGLVQYTYRGVGVRPRGWPRTSSRPPT